MTTYREQIKCPACGVVSDVHVTHEGFSCTLITQRCGCKVWDGDLERLVWEASMTPDEEAEDK